MHAQVELLQLPDGVPEELRIVCTSKHATLIVRTQRVVYQGVEMSASKFEQMCGKGDSKKWKISFW